jgi:formylmethanofuran dehydrogenase subunit E-like metal-binding protein
MPRMRHATWILFVLFTLTFVGAAAATPLEEAVSQAMQALKVSRGDARLLLLTDAPYVRVQGASALPYLHEAQSVTGCTVGQGNLLFFQRPQAHPLRMLLFEKTSGKAVILSREGQAWCAESLDMGPSSISRPAFWDTAESLKAGKDLFTLAAVANVWAKGAPYDFLKSAELHNHICPGLTSGYLMAHYILRQYPLQDGERYTVVACPVWCKEDALQVVLDCTPGKKSLIVKDLSASQLDRIAVPNPAGLLLIWNPRRKTGRGVALSFDFDRLRALVPADTPKAASVLAAVDHLDQPERFVSAAAEFPLDETFYQRIVGAGHDPYEVTGLVKK